MNQTANALRGEARFQLGNRQLRLRPSFENLVAAEEEIGSLFALVERASEGALTLTEVSALIWHCIDTDPRPSREDVGQSVLKQGLIDTTKPVRAILSQVLQGQS
ncbi:gene transfer agent family protein [uncultured Erythrobacter sp.]|uniref:gene transfer agent family protein n=1 Tax=uncultured Erythrobacter sp. TaxID=263913 RepID=UPI0026066859|nr:gene transfer agent family protein [uncultured Erythrobacter sp.]